VYDILAENPFFMRMSLKEYVGKNLMSRAHRDPWKFEHFDAPQDISYSEGLKPIDIIRCMLQRQNLGKKDA
jgi:hypothetical protein